MAKTHFGSCLCGEIRYTFDEPIYGCVHCHCESCRKATGSPMTTFVGVHDGTWRWLGKEPAVYRSSPGVRRYFCASCGSPIAYISESLTNRMHFYAAGLDNPNAVEPEGHSFRAEKLSWLHLADTLPDLTGGKWS